MDWVLGACLLTKKLIFEKVGTLKEEYFVVGGDVEFCHRVNHAGWNVGVLTNESIIHLMGKSTEKNLMVAFYYSINNNLANIKIIYNDHWRVLLAKIIYLIGILMRSVLAIFRKDRKATDYLKIFMRIFKNKH